MRQGSGGSDYLTDTVQSAQKDLVEVTIIQEAGLMVHDMLDHCVHLQATAISSPSVKLY